MSVVLRRDPFGNVLPRYVYWHTGRDRYYVQVVRRPRVSRLGSFRDLQTAKDMLQRWWDRNPELTPRYSCDQRPRSKARKASTKFEG